MGSKIQGMNTPAAQLTFIMTPFLRCGMIEMLKVVGVFSQ
jgi:hypothetical protein